MSRPLQTVHIRVNDAATGQPTPARLRITDSEGNYYPPLGRLARFATGPGVDVGGNLLLGSTAWAYIDGSCEVRVPAGQLRVQICKGPEYQPLDVTTNVPAGKLALRFAIERRADLRALNWYAGDSRAHAMSPHAALLEAAAEDLAVVNLLAEERFVKDAGGQDVPAIPDITAFSGQEPALEFPGHLVVVNTHNVHPQLGSLGLLNCHRIVYPLRLGVEEGYDNWTLADWCDQCHRKNGLVVWTRLERVAAETGLGEPLADLILGKVDAVEMTFWEDSSFDVLSDWYALLNCGLRVPLVGGSGKDSNAVPLGAMRTYARLATGEEFTYRSWIEAVRAGRTFVTNSPLLSFTVDGQDAGTLLHLPADRPSVHVHVKAWSLLPFDCLEVVRDGEPVADVAPHGETAQLDLELPAGEGSWLAARVRGQHQLPHAPAPQRVFAHTTPVYLARPAASRHAGPAASRLRSALQKTLEWAERQLNERQRTALIEVLQAADAKLQRQLSTST